MRNISPLQVSPVSEQNYIKITVEGYGTYRVPAAQLHSILMLIKQNGITETRMPIPAQSHPGKHLIHG
jgi:hypothetical protein